MQRTMPHPRLCAMCERPETMRGGIERPGDADIQEEADDAMPNV